MQAVFPVFYFPPISYFIEIQRHSENFMFENHENFIKQTYRNRCKIVGANGTLNLVIPVQHSGNRLVKDIKISYTEDWQKLHVKSIKTAYQTSPYFEFYEDAIFKIFDEKETYLLDFNLKSIEVCFQLLKWNISLNDFTNEYKTSYNTDFRSQFIAKQPSDYQLEEYTQVFSDRMDFQNDASILDLLCNIGTKSATYIQST